MSTVLTGAAYHTELIDGQEVEKPLPKLLHARIQSFLIRVLASMLSKRIEVLSELNVLCGKNHEDHLVPDVTVVARNPAYRNGDLFHPAILCVEIFSPGQMLSNLFDKAERLLKAGTPVCWIVWPERRQAWMYRQSFLIRVLASMLSKRIEVLSELNVLCGKNHEDHLVPDVTVVARNPAYRNGDLFHPAILCVEIFSPGQMLSNLFDKAERLLKAGTPVCWIVWPERRQAWMYRQDELREAAESLSVILPEGERLDINLHDMWAELE